MHRVLVGVVVPDQVVHDWFTLLLRSLSLANVALSDLVLSELALLSLSWLIASVLQR